MLFLVDHLGVILAPDFREIDRRLGIAEAEVVHRAGHDLRHCQVPEPLVVRRNDVPGRMLGAGRRHGVLEGRDVVVPQRALGIVRLADLPVACRILEAFGETGELRVAIDVQVKLEDRGLVLGQQRFEFVDPAVAPCPGVLVDQLVDPGDQHVLVVRPVEDGDFAASWGVGMDAPEKIMGVFLRRRLLEAGDARSLRIEGGEDMIDRAVLAGGIEGLQDDEHGMPLFGIEQRLKLAELLLVVGDRVGGLLGILVVALEPGVDPAKADLSSGFDGELLAVIHDHLRPVVQVIAGASGRVCHATAS